MRRSRAASIVFIISSFLDLVPDPSEGLRNCSVSAVNLSSEESFSPLAENLGSGHLLEDWEKRLKGKGRASEWMGCAEMAR